MEKNLILEDKNYISARRAAFIFGYTSDYIGQLCRAGKLECKMIGRSWFVSQDSITKYKVAVSPEVSEVNDLAIVESSKLDDAENVEVTINVEVQKEVPTFKSFEPVNYSYSNTISNLELSSLPVGIPLDSRIYLNSSLSSSATYTSQKTFLFAGIGMLVLFFVIFIQASLVSKNSFITNSSTIQQASVSSASKELVRELVLLLTSIPKMAFNVFTNNSGNSLAINASDNVRAEEDPPDFNGLAVVQSTGSEVKDEILKQKIRDSFSDEVKVKQDQTGTSGIITPVFKKVAGNENDFIYVLVPVTSQLKN